MGVSVNNAVNEVFYERSQTFIRENLLNNGKKPADIHVVCYPDVTEADVRAYSGLGVPKENVDRYQDGQKSIDVLSIATSGPINGNIPVWLIEEIAGKHALADKAVVATHFAKSDFDEYAIPPAIITSIIIGMNYVNLNPVFARNPECDNYAAKIMQAAKKLEQGETDLTKLIRYIQYNSEEQPKPEGLDEFHISQKGFLIHFELLKKYVKASGFPVELADLAVYDGGMSCSPSRHWSYKYQTRSGQTMLVDFFSFERFKNILEKYRNLFDKIYNGLESVAFDSEEQRQLFSRDIIRDYDLIGRITHNVFSKRYNRKQLQSVQKVKANDATVSSKEEFEAFVKQVREQGVFIYDPDGIRIGKNIERLGLRKEKVQPCRTVKNIIDSRGDIFRRGIEYYTSQQQFGLYIIQGSDSGKSVKDALEEIGLNPNGKSPRIIIIGNGSSLEQQVNESVETLSELGIEINVAFLNSAGNGHINEGTKLTDVLREFT